MSEPKVPATIEDVAARSGFSVATVSRALRGLPHVASSTRHRVLEAAEALSYRPDPLAARLAAGKTYTIGVALPFVNTWYHSQVLAGVDDVMARAGFDLLVMTVGGPAARHRFMDMASGMSKRVDALVFADLFFTPGQFIDLEGLGVKAVTIGLRTEVFDSIVIDNETAGFLATQHLVQLGHRMLALIGGRDDRDLGFEVPDRRRAGYLRALESAGIEARPELEVNGGFTVRGGAESMAALLARRQPPTAVFAMSDGMAMGAIRAAADVGRRVPSDLSIVGFDDHELAEVMGLTTIHQEVTSMAAWAAQRLLLRLEDEGLPLRHQTAPTRLVVRSSTSRLTST